MPKKYSVKDISSKLLKVLYYVVISFVCLIAFLLIFYIVMSQINANNDKYRPKISLYTIVSPSMNPVINVYDVVVNYKVSNPSKIQIGDIITYVSASASSDGMTITHRVIEVQQLDDGTFQYLTQGDNNESPDSLYITYDQVLGKEIMIIPKLGKLQFLIANKKGWLFLLLIPIALYIFRDSYQLFKTFALKKKVEELSGVIEDPNIEEKREKERLKKEEIRKELEEKNIALVPQGQQVVEKPVVQTVIKPVIVPNVVEEPLKFDEMSAEARKRKHETSGFLEKYSETVLTVKEDKYAKQLEKTKDEEIKTRVIKPKIVTPSVVDKKIEVLDTDELTRKIKQYDEKLAEIESILKTLKKASEPKKEVKESVSIDNYLKEDKIKVVASVPTKNQKRVRKSSREKLNLNPKQVKQVNKNVKIVKAPVKKIIKKNNKVVKVIKPGFVTITKTVKKDEK